MLWSIFCMTLCSITAKFKTEKHYQNYKMEENTSSAQPLSNECHTFRLPVDNVDHPKRDCGNEWVNPQMAVFACIMLSAINFAFSCTQKTDFLPLHILSTGQGQMILFFSWQPFGYE